MAWAGTVDNLANLGVLPLKGSDTHHSDGEIGLDGERDFHFATKAPRYRRDGHGECVDDVCLKVSDFRKLVALGGVLPVP